MQKINIHQINKKTQNPSQPKKEKKKVVKVVHEHIHYHYNESSTHYNHFTDKHHFSFSNKKKS